MIVKKLVKSWAMTLSKGTIDSFYLNLQKNFTVINALINSVGDGKVSKYYLIICDVFIHIVL